MPQLYFLVFQLKHPVPGMGYILLSNWTKGPIDCPLSNVTNYCYISLLLTIGPIAKDNTCVTECEEVELVPN